VTKDELFIDNKIERERKRDSRRKTKKTNAMTPISRFSPFSQKNPGKMN